MQDLNISTLGHTWLIDIDGCLLAHNGYIQAGGDKLLMVSKEFFSQIPPGDMIILLTSRKSCVRSQTENFLNENGIRYDHIIFDLPYGERILINDIKPSGMKTALCVNVQRDKGIDAVVKLDENL